MQKIYLIAMLLFVSYGFTNAEDDRNAEFIIAIENYYAPLMERLSLESIDSMKITAIAELTETEFNIFALEILNQRNDNILDRFTLDTSCITLMNSQMKSEIEYNTGQYEKFKKRRDECVHDRDSLKSELARYQKPVDSCKHLLEVTNPRKKKGYLVTIYIVQHHKERPATRGQAKYLVSDDMVADYFTDDKMKQFYKF